ncbi:MAG: hypothetical protein H7070_00595 [Saprospiraceae bacterium]|nr:hypothetical protein [Pyrinomonadaceae bacterium]
MVGPPPAPHPPIGDGPHNFKGLGSGERAQIDGHTLKELDHRYVVAINSNNEAEAIAIFLKALALIWELAKAHGEALQTGRNEAVVEFYEFNAAVDGALNPGMLRTNIRYMSREEFRALKNAPTPDFFRTATIRIAQRITTRTLPASRRAGK